MTDQVGVSPVTRSSERSLDAHRPEPEVPPDPVPSGREVIHRAITSTGEWQLQRRNGHYELICNGVFLMASYNRASDRALAALALERVPGEGLQVLVGGLGIGFTVQATLEDPRVISVQVAEVEPMVVQWHRRYFAPLCGRPLEDPRTSLLEIDCFELPFLPGSYDAILLDTDNGPAWLARPVNSRLYRPKMVSRLLQALRPGGVLAVWSSDPAPEFARVLAQRAHRLEAVETIDEVEPDRWHPSWVYLASSGRNESSPGRLCGSREQAEVSRRFES